MFHLRLLLCLTKKGNKKLKTDRNCIHNNKVQWATVSCFEGKRMSWKCKFRALKILNEMLTFQRLIFLASEQLKSSLVWPCSPFGKVRKSHARAARERRRECERRESLLARAQASLKTTNIKILTKAWILDLLWQGASDRTASLSSLCDNWFILSTVLTSNILMTGPW